MPHLRNYRTQSRAEVYANTMRKRFPDAQFVVEFSPFTAYAFRYLIRIVKGGRHLVGGNVYLAK